MTEPQSQELHRWISHNFWRVDHWYESLPMAAESLDTSPVIQASGMAAAELGFPVSAVDFAHAWDRVADEKRSRLRELCKRFNVCKLAGFGSAIRGSTNSKSDLDILVEFDSKAQIGFLALARLTDELATLFEVKVDLVPKNGLHPLIKDAVLAEAEVLFAA